MGLSSMAASLQSVGKLFSPPKMPAPYQPPPPPAASKAPDIQGVSAAMAGTGQAGGAPGIAQTMLTGAGGVNPDALKLGKTSLLGG
ncbi:MAG: hypothetical protein PSX71_08665 [bacterium]|nr:hypothetical protein [bacterium]